jgi:hypothetical protein
MVRAAEVDSPEIGDLDLNGAERLSGSGREKEEREGREGSAAGFGSTGKIRQ